MGPKRALTLPGETSVRASADAVRGGPWRDKSPQPHRMQEALSAAGGAGALAF